MRFLEKNKDVGIGDDYVVTVGGKEIPGSDFIDIMHFLMKSGGKEDAEKTFYHFLDESTGMPTGTKQFISALYHSIKKKPLTEKTSRQEKENFATKFKAFTGTAMEGVGNVLDEIQQDMHDTTVWVEERNVEDAIDDLEDEIKTEKEQERARRMMEEIDAQDEIVRARETEKEGARSVGWRVGIGKCRKQYLLNRLGLKEEDLGLGSEAEEEKERFLKKKRRMYHKAVETIGQHMKKLGGEKSMAEREIERFHEDLRLGDVRKLQRYKTPEVWQCTFAMSSRRAKQVWVEPTIEEKMQLESLRQNPTYEKIIKGDIIKKLFPEEEDDEEEKEEDGDNEVIIRGTDGGEDEG